MRRFMIVGTLVGGLLLSVLNWVSAAFLPPRFKPFRDPHAVVETIRSNVSADDIYAARQGLFVAVSLGRRQPQSSGTRVIWQFMIEFVVAFGLSLLLVATSIRSPLFAAGFVGLAGFLAGIETHFPDWNWSGFPTSYLLAGTGYLLANWFIVGLVLGIAKARLIPVPRNHPA